MSDQARGRRDAAENYYRQCLALMRQVQDASNEAVIAGILGRFLIEQRGQQAEGCQLLWGAVKLYEQMGLAEQAPDARVTAHELGCEE